MKGCEMYEAIVLGLGAVAHMAAKAEQSRMTFDFLSKQGKHQDLCNTANELVARHAAALRKAASDLLGIMNDLGDSSESMDGVEEIDMKATEHVFSFLRVALGIDPHVVDEVVE